MDPDHQGRPVDIGRHVDIEKEWVPVYMRENLIDS